VAGEIARAAGLSVPELVFAELDGDLARTEPDPEIQDLIRASAGLNLALDYLPGAVAFDPVTTRPDAGLASSIVWFDAFVSNVDRTPRNTNMLLWHRRVWLIDHGAALYFHHGRDDFLDRSGDPFPQIEGHVLLTFASRLQEIDAQMIQRITPDRIAQIVGLIPDAWLAAEASPGARRTAYEQYLSKRLQTPRAFVEEAIRARSVHL
jgi:hypothetical protein